MIPIEILLAYCRADEDDKDAVSDAAQDAESFLSDMGADPDRPVYNKTLKALTLHFFDHPAGGEFSPALQKLVNTLKS